MDYRVGASLAAAVAVLLQLVGPVPAHPHPPALEDLLPPQPRAAGEPLLSEAELSLLRSRLVMQKILDKLGMPARPNRTAVLANKQRRLPAPLRQELAMEGVQADQWHPPQPQAVNTQTVIFAKPSTACPPRPRGLSTACLQLEMPEELSPEAVAQARLMLYKRGDVGRDQTLALYESTPGPKPRRDHGVNKVTLRRGWVEFDLRQAVREWAGSRGAGRTKVLEIVCKGCVKDRPIYLAEGEHVPFLEIKLAEGGAGLGPRLRERRSHHSCHSSCCKREQYIDFEELQEDDWIIQPSGFWANHCQGHCSATIDPTLMAQNLRHRLRISMELFSKEMSMCCAPTRYSPIKILYWDNEGKMKESRIENMVVEDCGCK